MGGRDAGALSRLLDRGLSPDSGREVTLLTVALRRPSEGLVSGMAGGGPGGGEKMAEMLLAHGADPNLVDAYGIPPLCYAVQECSVKMVERLLEKGAKVNGGVVQGTRSADELKLRGGAAIGRTALSMAAMRWNENPAIVNALLAAGADPNIVDAKGKTALDYLRSGDWRAAPGVEAALMAKGAKTAAEVGK